MYDFAIIGTALTTTAGLAGATQKYYYNKGTVRKTITGH